MSKGLNCLLLLMLLAFAPLTHLAQSDIDSEPLNPFVLAAIDGYSNESYPYLLDNDYASYNGVTQDIIYRGRVLLRAHPSGNRASHCVGITFEVFFHAMQRRNQLLGLPVDDFNGMKWDDLLDFALDWYAAKGPKPDSNLAVALERYGIGRRIAELEAALPGDFIDFTRANGTGHAAVFLEWVREQEEIVGVTYWSSQGSTGGIGVHSEYFQAQLSKPHSNLLRDSVIMARVLPVSEYESFWLPTPWQRFINYLRHRYRGGS